jgi:hypothetical protein
MSHRLLERGVRQEPVLAQLSRSAYVRNLVHTDRS